MADPKSDGGFVHLHVHSEFSLLDGLSRIPEMTQRVADQGMPALALTDHGSMYGVIPFYAAAKKAGIKPIIGIEAYVAPRGMTDKEGKQDADYHHMILLARDDVGYKNLLALTTAAHLDGYYYKPRIDKELLARHARGLIGTSACLGGEVLKRLGQGDEAGAARAADEYRSILGDGNFFIEVQAHGIGEQERLHPQLVELARRNNLPLVATNDTHYTSPDQYEAHDLLVCIQTASNVDTPGRMRFENNEFYLKSAAEMRRLFNGELPDAMDNTLLIAEECDVNLDFTGLRLPHFEVPEGETEASWLRKECERGLIDRYGTVTDAIRNRLDYELGIIDRMGYSAYFLIVADFTRFAREQGIMITCRGSAPGSIVTYSLKITPVDPLEYGLPFERFLNPDRVTMPDIDIDFQDSRRDEVIQYVTAKYGDDRVAQIITFGTLGAKAAIRDVGRAMGLTYAEADRVAKAVPLELNISLDRAVETSPPLRELMAGDDRVDKLIGIAKQLEGVSRHASTHAAGIVISRDPLTEIMPLQRATDGKTTMTQFEMHACEALGLLKFDFLGLINLTILADAVDLVRTHRSVELDVDALPLDDLKTFELLGRGETMGVFQLEGSGMRRYVKELKPTEVRDLAAMVALFRPGPMANIPAYIRRKHGEEPVTYLHETLEPALRDTYGIFVYQEDIMTAAIAMADYTGPEADNLCYAIRKKKEDVLRQHEAKFKAGAKKKGIPPHIVDKVFHEFEPFARYGFNKAHATCYGLIAYQTAYLKANYPIEFMTAVMNGFRERAEKVAAVIAECRRLEIPVRAPDVHKSDALFAVEIDESGSPQAIRFGLTAIKNVGEASIEAIVAARRDGAGAFVSLEDFCRRVDAGSINSRVVDSLARARSMDSVEPLERLLRRLPDGRTRIEAALEAGAKYQREVSANQVTLFESAALAQVHTVMTSITADAVLVASTTEDEVPIGKREKLRWEKELIGLYLSEHPLSDIEGELPEYVTAYTGDLAEESDQAKVTMGGILISSRRVITRAGSTMLVATLEDLQGSVEVVVFPKVFEQTALSWADDSVVLVSGRVDRRDDSPQILCEAVHAWDDAVRMGPVAFGAERDRLLAARPGGRRWERQSERSQGVWTNGERQPIAVEAPTPMAVAVVEPEAEAVAAAIGAPAPVEETPAPTDAVPIQSAPVASAAIVSVSIGEDVPADQLLGAIESVKGALSGRPGPLPVVLSISVAGASRRVRLPDRVAWDERLAEVVRQAAGVPLSVELRSGVDERPA